MTTAALSPFKEYIENAVSLNYGVPFRFNHPTHIRAQRIAPGGAVTVLAYGVDYSVTGGSTDAGGTLTVAVAGAVGVRLQIRRATPRDQAMKYTTSDTFPATSHEAAIDKAMLVDQEQDEAIGDVTDRALMVPIGESAQVLDPASVRANKFQSYDPLGVPISSLGTGADAGLRGDLGSPLGTQLILGPREVYLETELTDRGTVIDGQTLTAPLVLAQGKHHVGRGQPGWIVMSNRASGLVTASPPGGGFDQNALTENMFVVHSGSFADCGDHARDVSYSGYGIEQNNRYWGGQVAAVRIRNSVGHMSINEDTARSPIGHLFEIVSGIQNTVMQYNGGTSNILGTAVKSIGRIDYLSYKNRAFDHFNDLIADAGPVYNLHFDTCWFEEYGHGTVEFPVETDPLSPDFGRVTGYVVHSGAGDGIIRLGSAKAPRFTSPIFTGGLTFNGGFAPIVDAPHCVGGSFFVQRNGFARGVFHMRNMTGPNAGTVGVDQSNMTLPEYGEAGTVLEHYGVSASHTSLAIAEVAGVAHAAGMGHANLYTSEMDGAAWATKTATLTPGRPDPWGGTTAFGFSGTPGQGYANFYIPELSGGVQFCQVFLLRAQAIDNVIALRAASTGLNAFQRLNHYHFTDTRWRIAVLRGDLPAGGDYTTSIEIVNGAFDIAASQLTVGYDLKPILRGGQSVTGSFRQIDRSIVKRGSAIPVTGKWWAGDMIEYHPATAATRKREGAICTVGDGSGVGTWEEYGFVANPAAAIPDLVAPPDENDFNAVLAVLRGMRGIFP